MDNSSAVRNSPPLPPHGEVVRDDAAINVCRRIIIGTVLVNVADKAIFVAASGADYVGRIMPVYLLISAFALGLPLFLLNGVVRYKKWGYYLLMALAIEGADAIFKSGSHWLPLLIALINLVLLALGIFTLVRDHRIRRARGADIAAPARAAYARKAVFIILFALVAFAGIKLSEMPAPLRTPEVSTPADVRMPVQEQRQAPEKNVGALLGNQPPSQPVTWRVYRNEEYGFEFTYPSTLQPEDAASDGRPERADMLKLGTHMVYVLDRAQAPTVRAYFEDKFHPADYAVVSETGTRMELMPLKDLQPGEVSLASPRGTGRYIGLLAQTPLALIGGSGDYFLLVTSLYPTLTADERQMRESIHFK